MEIDEKLKKRFFDKIKVDHESGCWEWVASRSKGYGQLFKKRGSPPLKAHRLSYEIHKGEIPDGLVVRHECDNPGCCNPDHLLIGTQKDNAIDTSKRNRLNPKSRLNLRPGRKGHRGAAPPIEKESENVQR